VSGRSKGRVGWCRCWGGSFKGPGLVRGRVCQQGLPVVVICNTVSVCTPAVGCGLWLVGGLWLNKDAE
jgi:hypothetical protein